MKYSLSFSYKHLHTKISHSPMSISHLTCQVHKSLDDWSRSSPNTIFSDLKAEETSKLTSPSPKSQFIPREVRNAHYSYTKPEKVPSPTLIAYSKDCMNDIGLDDSILKSSPSERDRFTAAMAGNLLLPGLDQPYCTV